MAMLADAAIVVFVAMVTPLLLTRTRTHEVRLETELVSKVSFQTPVKTEKSH
jgi:hypothetical protein